MLACKSMAFALRQPTEKSSIIPLLHFLQDNEEQEFDVNRAAETESGLLRGDQVASP